MLQGTLKMNTHKKVSVHWLSEPEKHDYLAARSYMSLMVSERIAKTLVKNLKHAAISQFKAKDVFRASDLSLLGVSNSHVEKDRQKILSRRKLSPILLVRNEKLARVTIADGYHRLCAIYSFDEDAVIPCKIVGLDGE